MSLNRYLKSHTLQFHSVYQSDTAFLIILGKDNMIVDDQGESSVSVEDYAVAMIDEVEYPTHHYERFTIGY